VNPSTDVRIDSMIRALSDFVIPDLPAGGTGAQQAALVLGHLHVLRGQIDLVAPFEEFELRQTVTQAQSLIEVSEGGERTTAAAAALEAALAEVDDRDPGRVRGSAERLRGRIEELLRASAEDGTPAAEERVQGVVVASERVLADAYRSLFAGNGWESGDDAGLPDLDKLLARP
jgi:hypothetical protein